LDLAFATHPANKQGGNIHLKPNVVLGESQKAVRYGQGQPETGISLKTSSVPLPPCFSTIPPKEGHPRRPFLEVHWEEIIWNIGKWEAETAFSRYTGQSHF